MKRVLPIIIGAVLYGVVVTMASQVSAASLVLEKIGNSVFNSDATSWTHYGTNPIFQGSATPSATVILNVDGVSETSTTADSSGSWSITPTSLDSIGTYEISFTSGAEEVALSLSIASSSADTTTTDTSTKGGTSTTSGTVDMPETLPETGSDDIFFLLGIGGVMLVAGAASSLLFNQES